MGEAQNYKVASRHSSHLIKYKAYAKLVYIRFVGNNLIYNFLRESLSERGLVEDLVNLEVGLASLEIQSWTRKNIGLR